MQTRAVPAAVFYCIHDTVMLIKAMSFHLTTGVAVTAAKVRRHQHLGRVEGEEHERRF